MSRLSTAVITVWVWLLAGCAASAPEGTALGAGGSAVSGPLSMHDAGASLHPAPASTESTRAFVPASGAPAPPASDPTIRFEWTQGPTSPSDCQPGRYAGTFACTYGEGELRPVPVTGPVEFVLERTPSGEFLEISEGMLEGAAFLAFGFRARLEGRLNCSTKRLEAHAVDGLWGVGDPATFTGGQFDGVLEGTYDAAAMTLTGTWNLDGRDGLYQGMCVGPWEASRVP